MKTHAALSSIFLLLNAAACGAVPEEVDVQKSVSALQVTYAPDADTWTHPMGMGIVDYGVSRELRTNNIVGVEQPKKIYLHFPVNLGAVCPTLVSATLRLTSAQLAGGLYVYPHPVGSNWMPGNTGQAVAVGCAANSGASQAFNPPMNGGPLASQLINQTCTQYSWNITPIVQGYCASGQNRGILMAGRMGQGEANFFSMEAAIAARRPQLDISY